MHFLLFDNYLNIFDDKQLNELYKGYKKGLNYKIYAKPEYDWKQMNEIRLCLLEKNLDVSIYSSLEFEAEQMWQIREGLEKGLDVSLYAKPEFNNWKMK